MNDIQPDNIKVIYIISFSPKYEFLTETTATLAVKSWKNQQGEFVGVWKEDFGHIIGFNLLHYYKNIQYEVWRPDRRADKIYEYTFPNGMKHKSFPAGFKVSFWGLKRIRRSYSTALIKDLYKLFSEQEKIVLIIPFSTSFFVRSLIRKFRNKFPIINPHLTNNELLLPKVKPSWNPVVFLHRLAIKIQTSSLLHKIKYITLVNYESKSILEKKFRFKIAMYNIGFMKEDYDTTQTRKTARANLNIPDDLTVLLASSRLVPEKQVDKMIEVLSRFSNYNFICYITGNSDPEYFRYLSGMVTRYQMDQKIIFTGFVLREQLLEYYLASDLYLMTSGLEAGPGSSNPAIMFGIPIISTDTGLIAQMLKENNAGKVVPVSDLQAWEQAIRSFLDGEKIPTLDKNKLLQLAGAEENSEIFIKFIKHAYDKFYAPLN